MIAARWATKQPGENVYCMNTEKNSDRIIPKISVHSVEYSLDGRGKKNTPQSICWAAVLNSTLCAESDVVRVLGETSKRTTMGWAFLWLTKDVIDPHYVYIINMYCFFLVKVEGLC